MADNKSKIVHLLNGEDEARRYYVYRLIDPRTLHTFYVGKGTGKRVFQHVEEVESCIGKDGEDALSLKAQVIKEIIKEGKKVISVIHRRGLTEEEALEVEAALIDTYPGLTNKQKGHGAERGLISMEDLEQYVDASVYEEPSEDYIIIKIKADTIATAGSLYEATRQAWVASLERAEKYKYVLSVVGGIVREVYEVKNWYKEESGKIAFTGKESANEELHSLIGWLIPEEYRQRGASNPFLYKK